MTTSPVPAWLSQPEERAAALRLALIPGVGPKLFQRLVAAFGSPCAVLRARPTQWARVAGVGPELIRRLASPPGRSQAERLVHTCQHHGIRILLWGEADYPALLRQIPDPPIVLYCKGTLSPQDDLAVSLVGTRCPSPYGLMMAERLARDVASAGVSVVSGLARGIDRAAHQQALAAGGRTIAVLACGLHQCYPREHERLAGEICRQGALLSELPPWEPPRSSAFPRRNRLISGLALGTVVVEAPARSGALITAGHAVEQNREVFAVPGRADWPSFHGCHALIRQGARLVTDACQILEDLGPLSRPIATENLTVLRPSELNLNPQEQAVLRAIELEPTDIEQVVQKSGLPLARALATLSVLEVRGLVGRAGGRQVYRRSTL